MGLFDENSDQAQAWQQADGDHEAKLSHELLAGAASYEAAKKYEEYCNEHGQPQSHEEAKEIFAGFAGAYVDREVETRGLDFIDREKAKREATEQADDQLRQSGGW